MLIGWDSADWKIIHPLVKAGKMPALARMLAEGVCGNVTTLEPQLSPMLWTSIATGKHAPQHGVPGFTEVNHAGQVVPVSAATRRCKALWDMAGEHGLRSHVVSWFATQGEQPAGCLVSNLYNSWRHTRDQEAQDWPPPPSGTYWPEKLGADLNERRVSPWDVDPDEIIRLFVPDAPQVDQANDQRLKGLAQRLSEAFTVHSATCWLLENRTDWNLFAVYYRALDEICHQFMHYHPPQMAGIKDADFAMYRHVVEGAYRLHDLFLARLMDLAGPGTAFVLVSDHGFHSDHLRPEFTPRVPAGITVWHRPQGILCAMGPGFKKGADHYGARLLDVTPTILTWLGMPVGADMEGRVLTGLFENPPQVEVIPSWENTGHPRRMGAPLTAEDQKALLEQFVELGYISPVSSDNSQAAMETARENDWNMARASMDCGRYEEALALLENVATLRPDRQDYLQMLAICRLRLGMLPEASAALETALQSIAAQTPATLLIMANIALEDKNAAAALTHLDAAARMEGFRPGVQHWEITIRTLLALHAWDRCRHTCEQLLALDPGNAQAHLGLCRCALHNGQPEQAAEHAMEAVSVQFGNPRGHFLLGAALCQTQDWPAAARALTTAIQLEPANLPAHRLLATALEKQGLSEAAAGALLASRLRRQGKRREHTAALQRLREQSAARIAEYTALRESRKAAAEAALAAREAHLQPAGTEFVLVSGLPRSGTSLMMQMLRRGGLEPMTDGQRTADEDNPEGYYEWEEIKNLPKNPLLISKAAGKVTKVIAALLPALPPRYKYRILWMTRPAAQIVASQAIMLQRRGTTPRATAEHLEKTQAQYAERILAQLRQSPAVEVLEIPYPDLVASPGLWAEKISAFLGNGRLPHADQMTSAVIPALYRNHSAA